MSDRVRILIGILVLYGATLVLGLAAAVELAGRPLSRLSLDPTVTDWVIFGVVLVAFTVMLVRFGRAAHGALNVMLTLAVLVGSATIAGAWLVWPWDWLAALGIVVLWRILDRVLVHDLAVMVGVAGISVLVGLAITPIVACILLAVMALYDVYSVYRSRTMVKLADRMVESGAVFGFLVPARPADLMLPARRIMPSHPLMMLGSGDIGLPLILAVSAVPTSPASAVVVAIASLIGVMVMHYLFTHQKKPLPMAALPPIAASAILGYAIAVLLGI